MPNSGKSEWLDALTINLAEQQGWRFAVCSMEKRPRDHARQLLEKRAQKPMLQASYAGAVARMTEQVGRVMGLFRGMRDCTCGRILWVRGLV